MLLAKTRFAIAFIILMSALSCTQDLAFPDSGPVTVSFAVSSSSKSYVSPEDCSVNWDTDDQIQLWASNSSGQMALQHQTFHIYGISAGTAVFTSQLSAPMALGSYTYFGISPAPESISNNTARYTVPNQQNGSGSGIMVARPTVAGPLTTLVESEEKLNLSMTQKLHLLKFYFLESEASLLGGEKVEKIECNFTRPVTGSVDVDIFDETKDPVLSTSGSSSIVLDLSDSPLEASTPGKRNYAFATIIPLTFETNDILECVLYTNTHIVYARLLPVSGRQMKSGHATPVRLTPFAEKERCKLFLTLDSNNIGEEIKTVTLTAPAGCKFGDEGTNVLSFTPAQIGDAYMIEYRDVDAFRSLSGKTIDIAMDSDHATMKTSFTVGNLSDKLQADVHFSTGWLLNENFSTVGDISSYDSYTGGSNAGSKSAVSILSGWTGARVGASAGKCIRIACRRETSAQYDARVDAAPLNGIIKAGAKLLVEFDYGDNNQYGGVYITPPDVGQYVYVGFHNSSSSYKSGDKDGTFDNKFYTHNKDGDYSKTPNHAEYVVTGASGDYIRIAIRTMIESKAGANNTTCWLYIDNVKVTITNQ